MGRCRGFGCIPLYISILFRIGVIMKKLIFLFLFFGFLISTCCFAQTYITVLLKSSGEQWTAAEQNQIIGALKDGTLSIRTGYLTVVAGRIHLNPTTTPDTTTDKLYNVSGGLAWGSNTLTTSVYMLQGIFEADSWTTTGRIVTLSTVAVAAGDQGVWTNFEAKEYDPETWRSNDTLYVPAGAEGFYQLNFYAFHSNTDMRGGSTQNALGEFRVGYKVVPQDVMYGSSDPFAAQPDAATVTTPVYLVAGDKIAFLIDISGTEATQQDVAIGISIVRMSGAF